MVKKEAQFQTKFNSWLRNKYRITGAYELKQTKKDSFPYRNLAQHQEDWLLAVSNGTAVYKISDESSGHKPFDCFCFNREPAFVVILYPSGTFYLIHIGNFVFYRDHRAKRKSLTEDEAKEIATTEATISK